MPKVNGLTQKQMRFVEEYLVDFNGGQAAVRAGYKARFETAYVTAHELLKNPLVREAIDKRLLELSNQSEGAVRDLLNRVRESGLTRKSPDRSKGVVYILRADNGLVKIGITINIARRLATLNTQLPYDLVPILFIDCNDCPALEQELHKKFANVRVRGEWFNLSASDIAQLQRDYGTNT